MSQRQAITHSRLMHVAQPRLARGLLADQRQTRTRALHATCVSVSPLARCVQELKAGLASQGLAAFDLVFVDHDKGAYVSDVQLLLDHGLIR